MKAGARSPGLPLGTDAQGAGRDPARAGAEAEAEAEADRFRSLLRAPAPGAAVLAGLASGPPPDPGPAARLVEELAERVLVGEEGEAGGGVRVLAKGVGIPGLEVAVRREGGGLVVELLAPHPADLALLRSGAAELVARLEARFATRAEVRVRRRGPEDGDGGAAP